MHKGIVSSTKISVIHHDAANFSGHHTYVKLVRKDLFQQVSDSVIAESPLLRSQCDHAYQDSTPDVNYCSRDLPFQRFCRVVNPIVTKITRHNTSNVLTTASMFEIRTLIAWLLLSYLYIALESCKQGENDIRLPNSELDLHQGIRNSKPLIFLIRTTY